MERRDDEEFPVGWRRSRGDNFNNTRLETTDTEGTRNPAYSSNIQAHYTQPLLRNFRIDQTRSNLLINELQSQITDLNLRAP